MVRDCRRCLNAVTLRDRTLYPERQAAFDNFNGTLSTLATRWRASAPLSDAQRAAVNRSAAQKRSAAASSKASKARAKRGGGGGDDDDEDDEDDDDDDDDDDEDDDEDDDNDLAVERLHAVEPMLLGADAKYDKAQNRFVLVCDPNSNRLFFRVDICFSSVTRFLLSGIETGALGPTMHFGVDVQLRDHDGTSRAMTRAGRCLGFRVCGGFDSLPSLRRRRKDQGDKRAASRAKECRCDER